MFRTPSLVPVLVVAAVTLAWFGCEQPTTYSGIGNWRLGQNKLGDSPGLCRPEGEFTWCQASPVQRSMQVSLGGQDAEAGLLYGGTSKDSTLVEIVLEATECRANDLRQFLSKSFGKPTEEIDNRMYWKKSGSFMAAYAPTADGSCRVNFVVASDTHRIAQLRAGKD